MIYLYNETTLTDLAFTETNSEMFSGIGLTHTDKSTEPATVNTIELITTKHDAVKEAIHNRYANGIEIKEKIARDYCIVKNHRVLIDSNVDELVDLGLANQRSPYNPSCIKNMVVLVLHKDSKYFIKKKYTMKKPHIYNNWVNDTKVIVMYLTTNNWNTIPKDESLSILIESGYGADHNVQITMTGEPVKNPNPNDNRPYFRNTFEAHEYTGTFPILKTNAGNRKPINKTTEPDTVDEKAGDDAGHPVAPVKYADDYKYSSIAPDDDGRRYGNRRNNFRDKDADDANYSKKYNGHPKKNKKFNKNNDRY